MIVNKITTICRVSVSIYNANAYTVFASFATLSRFFSSRFPLWPIICYGLGARSEFWNWILFFIYVPHEISLSATNVLTPNTKTLTPLVEQNRWVKKNTNSRFEIQPHCSFVSCMKYRKNEAILSFLVYGNSIFISAIWCVCCMVCCLALIWTNDSCRLIWYLVHNPTDENSFVFLLINRSPPSTRKSLNNSNSQATNSVTSPTTANGSSLSPQSGQAARNRSRSPTSHASQKNNSPSTTDQLQVIFAILCLSVFIFIVVPYFHFHRHHVQRSFM